MALARQFRVSCALPAHRVGSAFSPIPRCSTRATLGVARKEVINVPAELLTKDEPGLRPTR